MNNVVINYVASKFRTDRSNLLRVVLIFEKPSNVNKGHSYIIFILIETYASLYRVDILHFRMANCG